LIEAQNIIIQLRVQDRKVRLKLKEHLVDCEPTIDKAITMVRRTLQLHKQLRSMYQQNLSLKRENRTLKKKLQQLEIDHKRKGKIDFLTEET
jgi:regulator of replication initiation timing